MIEMMVKYPEIAAHLAVVRVKRLLNEWKFIAAQSTLDSNQMRKLQQKPSSPDTRNAKQ